MLRGNWSGQEQVNTSSPLFSQQYQQNPPSLATTSAKENHGRAIGAAAHARLPCGAQLTPPTHQYKTKHIHKYSTLRHLQRPPHPRMPLSSFSLASLKAFITCSALKVQGFSWLFYKITAGFEVREKAKTITCGALKVQDLSRSVCRVAARFEVRKRPKT